MKKQEYIKPSTEVIEMEVMSMVATSVPNIGIEDGSGTEILSNDRRGRWGDLWSNDKK